ncbi:MAG: hemolysin family protein [Alicyclobacillaceae bacterium]|nr:hemolysin family protein [Alicyclobacillaceae bacterium]
MDTPGSLLIKLIAVFALVLLNGFFVAAEFALVKVRSTRLQQLAQEGHMRARFAQRVVSKLDAYLSATQLGITLASLGLGWIGEPAVARVLWPLFTWAGLPAAVAHTVAFVVAFSFITLLHIVLGELAPKSLAIRMAEPAALWTAMPLALFYKVMYPAIWFLNGLANLLLRWMGIEPVVSGHQTAYTEEEIRLLVSESHRSGLIDSTEKALVDNIFHFSDRVAREVMVPRTDMVCLYADRSPEENFEIARTHRHTRYPVALGDKDHILGFIHVSDLYVQGLQAGERNLQEIIREVLRVPESMEISRVLRLMQKQRSQIAVVVDEYGGTAGILTLEDILEEIVGEIRDEFDEERAPVETVGNVTYLDGRILVEDVNDMFGLEIDDSEVDSIGGWVAAQLDGNPKVGKTVVVDDYVFEIVEVDNVRVTRLRVQQQPIQSQVEG